MIADTTSTPSFIDSPPDWGRKVSVVTRWATAIKINREGGEQRHKTRGAPRFAISYFISSIRPKAFALRRGEAMEQLGSAIVVPVWPTYQVAVSFATDSVTLTANASLKFKVGSWIYVKQGPTGCFRKIVSVATTVINLSSESSDIYPLAFSWGGFSAGARVYPCILGGRASNGFTFGLIRGDVSEQQIEIEEL